MTTAADHFVQALQGAKERAIATRRSLAEALGKEYQRGETERMRAEFIQTQSLIDAINKAIDEETPHAFGS